MRGHRHHPEAHHIHAIWLRHMREGGFGSHPNQRWAACTPNGFHVDLSDREVIEHEDGTISVAGEIHITYRRPRDGRLITRWRGFLERGVWRQGSFI